MGATLLHTNIISEHTLRRKTPNGTLAAGYDATPVDRGGQVPPTKHILMSPFPHENDVRQGSSAIGVPAWQYPAKQTVTTLSWPSDNFAQHSNDPNKVFKPVQALSFSPESQQVDQTPTMDSVLNQTLPMQHPPYYYQPGSTIPTVLPANLQHYPAPTGPIGTQFYGPYWPDGGFIPYRPAPITRMGAQLGEKFPPSSFSDVEFHFGNHADNMVHALHRSNTTGMQSFNERARLLPAPYGPQGAPLGQARDSLYDMAYPSQHYNDVAGGIRTASNLERNGATNIRSHRTPLLGASNQPGNAKFKERVFQWAHSVYVDLLRIVHTRQKINPYQPGSSNRRSSKPLVYPKPPRQPGFDPLAHSTAEPGHSGSALFEHQTYGTRINTNVFPDSTNQEVFGSHYQQASHEGHRPSCCHNQRMQWFPGHYSDRSNTIRRASGSAVPAMFSAPQTAADVERKASEALEILENLCQESKEEWVDGVLLAGCLAHGIGDFEKAISMYQRILDHDRDHVEALSNIAASLVHLNRKEEAASFWMEAVKLRPSQFEAVEHLVALLCSSHRGKEALHVIELVERALRLPRNGEYIHQFDPYGEIESETESTSTMESIETPAFEGDEGEPKPWEEYVGDTQVPGYGSSGYRVPGADNGRILALIHAKANMLFGLRDYHGTAAAFEEAVLIAIGRTQHGIRGLIRRIQVVLANSSNATMPAAWHQSPQNPILLLPEKALETSSLLFPGSQLPGLDHLCGRAKLAAISTTSNALLCLAKIYQDGMSQTGLFGGGKALEGVGDVLALYYLSLSLHPSASTANNIGLLLTSVQHILPPNPGLVPSPNVLPDIGIVPGSPTAIALAFYNYGLYLDSRHSHLYTNLGSLLKDVGQVSAAVKMYEHAVQCEGDFDIALANLANALKDQGRMSDAIKFYQRAVKANPDFAEAVCGLATSLNSVCSWVGRGGVYGDGGLRDRWHVDETGMLVDAKSNTEGTPGWMNNVIQTVKKQLSNAQSWGQGTLTSQTIDELTNQILGQGYLRRPSSLSAQLRDVLMSWHNHNWEGARIVKLVERASRCLVWQWYHDRHIVGKEYDPERYRRPSLPMALTTPMTPTVLPFHAFTTPLSAKQVRLISQQNALRMSVSTLRSSWLPPIVFPPPPPPSPHLNVGYVSSDFNNHPLAHLMQNVFGFHDPSRARAFCYATTPSDGSIHRQKIEADAPVFYDASSWPMEKLVRQIVNDQIHILINLNGYTRGARNEIFAARPAPISMSFMGFAGSLGAEWCDYLLSDEICIPHETLSPWRRNVTIEDKLHPDANAEDAEDWVYSENIIFTRASFFCCDHRQSGPDTDRPNLTWEEEHRRRWEMRKEIFPDLADDAIIFGNFNQLYKIDPTTFRTWLRILSRVPNSILWLLRFPDLGEQHLLSTARLWAGETVAKRVIFTDVASKNTHISRARVVDLFLDTPECNAHTTSADVVWSGTPVLTFGRRAYKMCSRMAGSIVSSALPEGPAGDDARKELIVRSEKDYEESAIRLANSLQYTPASLARQSFDTSPSSSSPKILKKPLAVQRLSHLGRNIHHSSLEPQPECHYQDMPSTYCKGSGRLMDLREMLWRHRWVSRLFNTRRWVHDLETGYEEAWRRWENGEGGDIWL